MTDSRVSKNEMLAALKKNAVVIRSYPMLIILSFYVIVMLILISGGTDMPEEFKAPSFSLQDIMGSGTVGLSEHPGGLSILYFFASW